MPSARSTCQKAADPLNARTCRCSHPRTVLEHTEGHPPLRRAGVAVCGGGLPLPSPLPPHPQAQDDDAPVCTHAQMNVHAQHESGELLSHGRTLLPTPGSLVHSIKILVTLIMAIHGLLHLPSPALLPTSLVSFLVPWVWVTTLMPFHVMASRPWNMYVYPQASLGPCLLHVLDWSELDRAHGKLVGPLCSKATTLLPFLTPASPSLPLFPAPPLFPMGTSSSLA